MNLGFKFSSKNGKNLLSHFHANETDLTLKEGLLDKHCSTSTSDLNPKLDRTTSTTFFLLPSSLPTHQQQQQPPPPSALSSSKFKSDKKLNLTSDFLRKIKTYYKK